MFGPLRANSVGVDLCSVEMRAPLMAALDTVSVEPVTEASPAEVDAAMARLQRGFEGWSANQRIAVVNCQVWQIADDSSGFGNAQEPVVRIRRGALGSYRMEVEGVVRSPRVKRVK